MMQIMLIVMVLSLCIILPINLTGDNGKFLIAFSSSSAFL